MTHQHRCKTKIRIKQTTDIRKKKNREKNFSFRRFLLNLLVLWQRVSVDVMFRIIYGYCHM